MKRLFFAGLMALVLYLANSSTYAGYVDENATSHNAGDGYTYSHVIVDGKSYVGFGYYEPEWYSEGEVHDFEIVLEDIGDGDTLICTGTTIFNNLRVVAGCSFDRIIGEGRGVEIKFSHIDVSDNAHVMENPINIDSGDVCENIADVSHPAPSLTNLNTTSNLKIQNFSEILYDKIESKYIGSGRQVAQYFNVYDKILEIQESRKILPSTYLMLSSLKHDIKNRIFRQQLYFKCIDADFRLRSDINL